MEVELSIATDACADCGGKLRRIGEDVTEELEYVPGRFIVNRIVRPRLTCAGCERFVQAALPSRPIERGRPGPGLLAHVLVSKYADHLPLYRQSQILERDGLDLDRSTLADWVGKSTALLAPLADAIGRHVLSAEAIFADDTPVRMLAPGTGRTQTARLWTYARDERPWGGAAPPAAWYRFSGDRKGQHPKDHLARFRGWMHADGYAGFEDLYRSGAIREVACMAHVRRKFVDVHRSQGSPIAEEAIQRIARLYAVEKEAWAGPNRWHREDALKRLVSAILVEIDAQNFQNAGCSIRALDPPRVGPGEVDRCDLRIGPLRRPLIAPQRLRPPFCGPALLPLDARPWHADGLRAEGADQRALASPVAIALPRTGATVSDTTEIRGNSSSNRASMVARTVARSRSSIGSLPASPSSSAGMAVSVLMVMA